MQSEIERILLETPRLKAREIAKKLGVDRSAVSSFLHANKNFFVQDLDTCTWSIEKQLELSIDLVGSPWVDLDNFEEAVRSSGSPQDLDFKAVTFVLAKDCKIMLDALARFLALSNQLAFTNKLVSIDFSDCMPTLWYLNRLGFIDLLDKDIKVIPRRPTQSSAAARSGSNDALVELSAIALNAPDNSIPVRLKKSFVSCTKQEYSQAAFTVLSELFGNVVEHSDSEIPGFVGLQFYQKGRSPHIQTVISDSGKGIVGTLLPILKSRYPKVADELEHAGDDFSVGLLKKIFTDGGISRKTEEEGRGLGLKACVDNASKFKVVISVRQERFELRVNYINGKITFSSFFDLALIKGTHICFDFMLDPAINSR